MARKFRKFEKAEEEKKVEIKKDVEIIPKPEPVIQSIPDEPKIVVTIPEEDVKDLDEKFGIDAEKEIKEMHFKFQDEYHFGRGEGDAVIDTLPESQKECVCDESCVCDENCECIEQKIVETPKPKPEVKHLSPAELRAYQRTGILRK